MAAVLTKFNVKVFASANGAVDFRAFIPVFHRFIQEQKLGGILVDVAEYTHIAQGSQVLLVAHEGQWILDNTGGQLGLVYSQRHAPANESATSEDLLRRATKEALAGCIALLAEPEAKTVGLCFHPNKLEITINDRLNGPNLPATYEMLLETVRKIFSPLSTESGSAPITMGEMGVSMNAKNPRERASVQVTFTSTLGVKETLARL